MQPQFPIYIPSKGRAKIRLTADYLDYCKVPYKIVIEPQQYQMYLSYVKDKKKLLVMDLSYKEKYETCDMYGTPRSTGAGAARNFIWEHSISEGYAWHWTMDDNIKSFHRFNKNERVKVTNGGIFRAMEDFCLRYENVAMAGPNYKWFVPDRWIRDPYLANTRIYSCNLIRNDVPFRWRGRYNEDTILSLDMLTAGWCTIQFNAFLQDKVATQSMDGGNTTELYHGGKKTSTDGKYSDTGTIEKSNMLVRLYPNIAKVVKKYGRTHHHVDYKIFKKTKLIRKKNYTNVPIDTEYGMKLHTKVDNEKK